MKDVVQGKHVSKHGEDPGDGVEVWDEPYPVQVVEQDGVVECLKVAEFGQILLDHIGVVLAEHAV